MSLELRTYWDNSVSRAYGPWRHDSVSLLDPVAEKTLTISSGGGDYWFGLTDPTLRGQITARWREVACGGGRSGYTYHACAAFIRAARGFDAGVPVALPLSLHHRFTVRRQDDETDAWLKLTLQADDRIRIRLYRGKFWDDRLDRGTLSFYVAPDTCPPPLYKALVDLAYAMLLDNALVCGAPGVRPLRHITARACVNSTDRRNAEYAFI